MSKLEAKGNCFVNSAKFVLENPDKRLTLVHANVTGQGGNIKGLMYCHAFVIETETLETIHGPKDHETVIDVAHDIKRPMYVPAEFYRKMGDVQNEIYYCRDELNEMIRIHEHWGPWEMSLVTSTDVEANANV
jgi:hypothetical protein